MLLMKIKKSMLDEVSITTYQPRHLNDPQDPSNSGWSLAIYRENCDGEEVIDSFPSCIEAYDNMMEFCDINNIDPLNCVIAIITTTYIQL